MCCKFTYGSNILPLSFMCLNFSKPSKFSQIPSNFAQITKPVFVDENTSFGLPRPALTAFTESPKFHLFSLKLTESVFDHSNLTLDYSVHIVLILYSLQDFTYITFKHFFCGIFLYSGTRHTQRSPIQYLFMRKLSLSQL